MKDNELNQQPARTIPFNSVPKDIVAWRGPKYTMYYDKTNGQITNTEVDHSEESYTIFAGETGKGFNVKKHYKTVKINE